MPGWVVKILPLTGFNPRAIQPTASLYTYYYYTNPPVKQEVTENSKTGYSHLAKAVKKVGGIRRLNTTAQWHVYTTNVTIGQLGQKLKCARAHTQRQNGDPFWK
jgi:hypothetical protein